MTTLLIAELELRLHNAKKDVDYWTKRRHNQVGNCPSDLQNYDQACRQVQNLEFQIKEAQDGHYHGGG